MASLDMDDLDIDGLIDDIDMDDAKLNELDSNDIDDADYIPSKDSSDDEQPSNNKRNEKQTDTLLKNGEAHKPDMTPIATDDEEEKVQNFGVYDSEMINKNGPGIDLSVHNRIYCMYICANSQETQYLGSDHSKSIG